MKICLVHEEYPEETNFGGIATYQKRMAEEFVRLGHTVVVIARGLQQEQHYFENGVEVFRVFKPTTDNQIDDYITYRKNVANLLFKLQDDGLDIIEVPDWGAETVLFEPLRKTPLVVRLHTPLKVWLKFNRNNFGNVTNTMLEWEDTMLKKADLVTCCSNILKGIICSDFNMPKDKILVTPNPANLHNFCKNTAIEKEDAILYVGSLEERKGVCVLAKALNLFFKKHPSTSCIFIGKDTNRNAENISTKEYIMKLIDDRFKNNIIFLGQLPNSDLNTFYNKAKVAVFPSLFDNFPYVTLEAMSTGIHIVGSKNSGMVEMLNDNSAIYNTPSYRHLAKRLHQQYEISKTTLYNNNNIERVKSLYSPEVICNNMLSIYERVIKDYQLYNINKTEVELVLQEADINEPILTITRNTKGVANAVIEAQTTNNKYILKRYNSKTNFEISNLLYKCYENESLNVSRPINATEIEINSKKYNIFNYINGKEITSTNKSLPFFVKLVTTDRKTNHPSTIMDKCNIYYDILNKSNYSESNIANQTAYVINMFEQIKDDEIFKQTYLNHGDISKGNVIQHKNNYYIIDFDEALIGPRLYDYAVICVKFFSKNGAFNHKQINKFKKIIKSNMNCDEQEFKINLKFYLCKILLEKFALHIENKIDLFSLRQQQDSFDIYLKLLNDL